MPTVRPDRRRAVSMTLLASTIVWIASLFADSTAQSLLSGHVVPGIHRVAEAVTFFGKGLVLALAAAGVGLLGLALRRRDLRRACTDGWVALCGGAILGTTIKHLVGRPRPKFAAEGIVHLGPAWPASLSSFPSGHTVSAFALAAAWSAKAPRLRVPLIVAASAVGLSRLLLGAHYLSDVVAGALLGIVVGRWASDTDRWATFRKHAPVWIAAGLLAGSVFLFFFRLGDVGLFDVDEAVFAEATREMVVSGDFVTPTYNGELRFDKPILFYWLMAGAYHVFGINELAARSVSALFASLLVLLVFAAVRRIADLPWATLAGILTLTSFEVIGLGHAAITDMVLMTFIAGALLAFYIGHRENDRRWYAGFYAGMALAVLTKGPVGIVLPGVIVFFFLLARGRLIPGLKAMWPIRGAVLFLLIAAPWYAAILSRFGMDYVQGFFLKHNVERFLEPNSGHRGFIGYYVVVILVGFFPWSLFAPRALWQSFTERKDSSQSPAADFNFFLSIWIAVFFVFFSISRTKLPNYVASLFPALAILVSGFLARRIDRSDGLPRIEWIVYVILGTLLALFFLAAPFFVPIAARLGRAPDYLPPHFNIGLGPYLLAAVLVIGVFLVARSWRRPVLAVSLMAVQVATLTVVVLSTIYPTADRLVQEPLRDFSRLAGERARETNGRIIVYDLNKPSIVFYSRHFTEVYRKREVKAMLESFARPEPAMLITRTSRIPPEFAAGGRFHRIGEKGGYTLASNEPLPIIGGR